MKKFLKITALVILPLAAAGFCAFLYFMPPFDLLAPETFSNAQNGAAPVVTDVQDPAQRAIAERGRYLVVTSGCIGCHQTAGPMGPRFDMYLAGGFKFQTPAGTFVSRNLTPDPETGLARRSDDEVKRVLRSGVMPDGRVTSHRMMPWGAYTSWTDEDLDAVVVYLRHLKPVKHFIPEPSAPIAPADPQAIEEVFGGLDYGVGPKEPR
jgi:mono/diheme cytochrome c family protein